MSTQRLLVGKPGLLTVTLVDTEGFPTPALGAVTVAVTSVSGAVIIPAGTAATAADSEGDGQYQVAVTPAVTFQLDQWVAIWTDAGDGSTQISEHEICGGYFFGLADVYAADSTLQNAAKYPKAKILDARHGVEEEAEFICDVSFVPRYRRALLDGTAEPEIYLPDSKIRKIRSASILVTTNQTLTFTAFQLSQVVIDDDFQIQRNDGGIWDEGHRNVAIEYEVGYDGPPAELANAALLRLRSVLNRFSTTVPNRSTSFVAEGGVTYRLDMPEAFKTGIPEVDAVYDRYSTREFDDQNPIPASHSVNFDPSWFSVYHGGRR